MKEFAPDKYMREKKRGRRIYEKRMMKIGMP
jgi:hypothetical protein